MRLKVSPKEALSIIDRLIYEGHKLRSDYASSLTNEISSINLSAEDKAAIGCWHEAAVAHLKNIFLDFTPVYFFLKPLEEPDRSFELDPSYAKMLDGGMEVLTDYYTQLSAQIFTPLFFVPDRTQICFFASVCLLEPDSNESTLCRFLFGKYNYHEWVEMADIFAEGFGGQRDEYGGKDRAMIENAYDGVNRKTNETFGFPVFKKNKTMICLNLPARFLREEKSGMAL